MKKLVSVLIALSMLLMFTVGFAAAEDDTVIRLGGLKGPTSMGLVKLMEDNAAGVSANHYEFSIDGSADAIVPKFVKGDMDIIAVPANLGAVLYNNTQHAVQLLAVNTLGVMYIVENGDTVHSVADLKGKTIYSTGKGMVPEYVIRYILSANGLEPDKDVTIEWKSEPSEIVATLAKAENGIAMLPQPFVTVAQGSIEGLRVALDLNEEWEKLDNGSALITGTLIIRKAFAEEHPELVESFLTEYQASTEYVNANTAEAAQLIEKYNIVPAAVAEKALPQCNIVFMAGADMQAPMDGYLKVLFDQNPAAVGGALPDDGFYYGK